MVSLVFGYVRVSTVEQETGFGREAQTERILRYCQEKNLQAPEIINESKSGESVITRHELNSMLARAETAAEQGALVHIVFAGLDRLTRDLIDQEAVTSRCFRTGVRLHSTMESENDTLDPSHAGDPMRTAIRQFFGIIHQLDKAIIQRRLDGGLAKKATTGGFTGGRVPFGYQSVNRELEIDEGQAPVVRQVFAMHAKGVDMAGIAGLIASTWPEDCRHWKKQQISRIVAKRELYEKGQYRPRGGVLTVTRPELVILHGDEEAAVVGADALDWERLPDPIRLSVLAIAIGRPEEEIKRVIVSSGTVVRWRRSEAYIPLESARRVVKVLLD